jgi:TonB family protein
VTFVVSLLLQVLLIALLVALFRPVAVHRHEIRQHVIALVTEVGPYLLAPSPLKAGGGGGGGDRDKLAASKGALPRFSRKQLAPPEAVIRNEDPKLPIEATVVVPPEIHLLLPQMGVLGESMSSILGARSNGAGFGGGIGSGSGGGVGSGNGPGVGPGWGGGIGGGVYRVGGGVTAPQLIYGPEPGFSDKALQAKSQGTVVLRVVVGLDGRTHDIRIQKSLGLGLDEQAIEAIGRWIFEPSRKDGVAVAVLIDIELNFRLY